MLILAEKPSVARDLAAVLEPGAKKRDGWLEGERYSFTWALGHLGQLRGPEEYVPELKGRWRLELLPVLPEFFRLAVLPDRQEQFRVVKELLTGASAVVVATDAGREGELIWEYIRELAGYQGPWQRLWLSESTPAAVRGAFDRLLPGSAKADLAAAARARAVADWIVGMNGTMALSARHGGLWSAGRVQTPTLALIVERERQIREFVSEEYHEVTAAFQAPGGAYVGQWFREKLDRLKTKAEAQEIVERVRGKTGEIVSLQKKEVREEPPRLFNLTDLQREANKRYGLTANATLAAAQNLYEKYKLLTYPRTDSRHLTQAVWGTIPGRLKAVATWDSFREFAGTLRAKPPTPGKRLVDDTKVSDHHALLPTDQAMDAGRLPPVERQVYELVVRRFLAALLPEARYFDTWVITVVAGESFRSKGRVVLAQGWRAVYAAPPPEENGEEAGDSELPPLQEGESVTVTKVTPRGKKTKAPPRYTEASLLGAMESAGKLVDDEALAEAMKERGIGTPATRAAIIETLLKRGYIIRKGKALLPLEKGEALIALVPPELRSVETTGEWERELREIENGRQTADRFLGNLAEYTRALVREISGQARQPGVRSEVESLGKCPRCGGEVVEGQKGFGCANWRAEHGGCKFVIWKQVAGKKLGKGTVRELLTKGETAKPVKGFKSKAGNPFEARLRLSPETGRVEFLFAERTPEVPRLPT